MPLNWLFEFPDISNGKFQKFYRQEKPHKRLYFALNSAITSDKSLD